MPWSIPYHNPTPGAPKYEEQRWRKEDRSFYASKDWRELRRLFLWEHPLCADCGMAANEVHHLQDRRAHPDKAYDWSNLQSLCHPCHLARRKRNPK